MSTTTERSGLARPVLDWHAIPNRNHTRSDTAGFESPGASLTSHDDNCNEASDAANLLRMGVLEARGEVISNHPSPVDVGPKSKKRIAALWQIPAHRRAIRILSFCKPRLQAICYAINLQDGCQVTEEVCEKRRVSRIAQVALTRNTEMKLCIKKKLLAWFPIPSLCTAGLPR